MIQITPELALELLSNYRAISVTTNTAVDGSIQTITKITIFERIVNSEDRIKVTSVSVIDTALNTVENTNWYEVG